MEEFHRRFDPELTGGEGPKRLKNLYFLYTLGEYLQPLFPHLYNVIIFLRAGKSEGTFAVMEQVIRGARRV